MIEEFKHIRPLDEQLSAERKLTVPNTLARQIFGEFPPETNKSSLPTYALIDAGRVEGLEELLETSQLKHQCLFKGKALEEFGGVAPWLVELKQDNTFTRNLFTWDDSNSPWHFWARNPAIFIRADTPFETLWQHCRKFIKVQDGDDKRSYFRYWEPRMLAAYVERPHMLAYFTDALGTIFGGKHVFFQSPYHGSVFQLSLPEPNDTRSFPLSGPLRQDIRRLFFYSNMFEQAEDFFESYPDECARYGDSPRALWKPLFEFVDETYAAGLKDPELRARFMILSIIKYPETWPAFCNEPGWQAVRVDPTNAETRFRDICAIMKHYSDRGRGAVETWW